MSYDTERLIVGRKPIYYVILHLDQCSRTFGSAPCTGTGEKCFNTRSTCKSVSSYSVSSKKQYHFCSPSTDVPASQNAIPSVIGVSTSPVKIDPGNSLGRRGECVITFQDHPHHDILIDPYVSTRAYDPMEQGTFWSKFKVRNRYYNGRIVEIYSGYIGDSFSLTNFQKRTYIIDNISGPDSSGKVSLTGRDILRLADDKKALCPPAGFKTADGLVARLSADISDSDVNLVMLPSGIGVNFSAGNYLRIGKEILLINSKSGDNFNCTRAQFDTEATEHKADDSIQLCVYFNGWSIVSVLYVLLNTYAGIDSAYLDTAQWIDEAAQWLAGVKLTSLITEPTGVVKLIEEIIKSTSAYIFWDEVAGKVKLSCVKPPEGATKTITESNGIIAGSFSIKEKPDERITQLNFHFNIRDYTDSITDIKNFKQTDIRIDVDAESPTQYNDTRSASIFSRWVISSSQVTAILFRRLKARRNNPIEVTFKIDAKDLDIWTGDCFFLQHRFLVDATGALLTRYMRVVEIAESKVGTWYQVTAHEADQEFEGRYCYVQAHTQDDFTAAADVEYRGGWIGDNSGEMSDGSEGYKIL